MNSTVSFNLQSRFHIAAGVSLLAAAVWMQVAADSTEGQASYHFQKGAFLARNAGGRILTVALGLSEFERLRPSKGWPQ